MQITVFIADDHQVVIDGFKSLLSAEPTIKVIGEVTDGLQVVARVGEAQPQVLLLDLMMPGMNGLEVIRQVRRRLPEVKVVVLSMHADLAYVASALRNGASGYVVKQAPAREVVTAIVEVMAGRRYLSPPLSEEALAGFEQRASRRDVEPYETLSRREREVLQLAAEGLTNGEIARRLGIGRRTVETHRANMMRKLALDSHAQLVRFAMARRLL